MEARTRYLPSWERFFLGARPGMGQLACVGQYDGSACATEFKVKRAEPGLLGSLHFDHEQEVREVLGEWSKARQALRSPPSSWMDGIEPGALCHILFSVEAHERWGDAFVRPRCKCCHVSMPHRRDHLKFVY